MALDRSFHAVNFHDIQPQPHDHARHPAAGLYPTANSQGSGTDSVRSDPHRLTDLGA
jgi:hypothetical protein